MTSPPDLSSFDTSQVTDMGNMMLGWSSMTSPPDLSSFDTSQVTNMGYMMYGWSSMGPVNIPIDTWQIGLVTSFTNFLQGAQLSTATYDATLIAWAAQDAVNSLSVHFGSSQYTSGGAAETARDSLIADDLWTITDGGAAP